AEERDQRINSEYQRSRKCGFWNILRRLLSRPRIFRPAAQPGVVGTGQAAACPSESRRKRPGCTPFLARCPRRQEAYQIKIRNQGWDHEFWRRTRRKSPQWA